MKLETFLGLPDDIKTLFNTNKKINLSETRKIICDHFNVDLDRFFSQDRSIAYIRAMFIYIVLDKIGLKYSSYGNKFTSVIGDYVRRNRLTVFHFKKQFENEYHLYDNRIIDGITLTEHFNILKNKIKNIEL